MHSVGLALAESEGALALWVQAAGEHGQAQLVVTVHGQRVAQSRVTTRDEYC